MTVEKINEIVTLIEEEILDQVTGEVMPPESDEEIIDFYDLQIMIVNKVRERIYAQRKSILGF